MDVFSLLYIRSFLPDSSLHTGDDANEVASTLGVYRCVSSPSAALTHIGASASPISVAPTIFSGEDTLAGPLVSSHGDDGTGATHASVWMGGSGVNNNSSSSSMVDAKAVYSRAQGVAGTPLALVAAHPSVRMALQRLSTPLVCPHGRQLHVEAHERLQTVERYVASRSSVQAEGTGRCVAFPASLLREALPAGRVDCALCQRGGAMSRRALVAYCRQRLHQSHVSGGCMVGRVRITQEEYSEPRTMRIIEEGNTSVAPMRLSIVLSGRGVQRGASCDVLSPCPRPRSPPPLSSPRSSCGSPLPHSRRPCFSPLSFPMPSPLAAPSTPPQRVACRKALETASMSDPAVEQLQLAMWWLRRCVAQPTGQRCVSPPTSASHVLCSEEEAAKAATFNHPPSPSPLPMASTWTGTSNTQFRGSASCVMDAEALARSSRAASVLIGCSDSERAATPPSSPPVLLSLQVLGLSAAALTHCFRVLTTLPCSCRVLRLLVHCAPLFNDEERPLKCAGPAASPSASPGSAISVRMSTTRLGPAAASDPTRHPSQRRHARADSMTCASFKDVGGGHPLRFDRDAESGEGDAVRLLGSPIPMPSQLPALFEWLEELTVAGLSPASSSSTSLTHASGQPWAEELLCQLQMCIPRSTSEDGRTEHTTRSAAAPHLRHLVLLDEPHITNSIRHTLASLHSPFSDSVLSAASGSVSPPPPLWLGSSVATTPEVEDLEGSPAATGRVGAAHWTQQRRHGGSQTSPQRVSTKAPTTLESRRTAHLDVASTLLSSPLVAVHVAGSVPCLWTPHQARPIAAGGARPTNMAAPTARLSPLPRVQFPLSPALPWICRYPLLRSLNLSHSTVTDEMGGCILAALPQLEELHLSWCVELQDVPAVLRRASARHLHVLNVVGLRALTSEALEAMCTRACPRLMYTVEELYLAQCPVTAVGCVAYACPHLTRLQLPDTVVLNATPACLADSEACGNGDGEKRAAGPQRCTHEDGFLPASNPSSLLATPPSQRGVALSVQGYSGLIPVLSRLFPCLTQLKLHDVQTMLLARADRQLALPPGQPTWRGDGERDEADALGIGRDGDAGDRSAVSGADLASARAAYAEHLRHGEFYDLHRLLPSLSSLYLDGCAELGQVLGEETGEDTLFSFGGATLSLACAVHDMRTLEHLLTWRRSVPGGTLRSASPQRGVWRLSSNPSRNSPPVHALPHGLRELRLCGCRSLRAESMTRVVVRCCPHLCTLSVADTLLNDTALSHLCDGLYRTLESIDLCGCLTLTDLTPLLRCNALRHARLPGGQSLTSRTMSVECEEGLRGLCALLGKLCPDLRRMQLHNKGSMDAAEVAQVSLMGRWLTEVDLSQVIGINVATMLALNVPTAPANVHGVLTRVNLSNTAMNNTMLRVLVSGVVGPVLQEMRLHGCHCVSDVSCLPTKCTRLRVVKLSGTSVNASSLSSLVEGLPLLADLDVRYCARVRDVHWLAASLRKRADHHLCASQRPAQQHEGATQKSSVGSASSDHVTQCSRCPVLRPHRPTMSLAAVQGATRRSLGTTAAAAAVVVASPLVGGRATGQIPSRLSPSHVSAVRPNTMNRGDGSGGGGGGASLPVTGMLRPPRPYPAPPTLPTPPLMVPAASSPAGTRCAERSRTPTSTASGPLHCLTQVAFGNNHCYLTAGTSSAEREAVSASYDTRAGSSRGKDNSDLCRQGVAAGGTAATLAPPEHTVVLQEAVPGLFAVLALWMPQTRVLVLLRPGSMGAPEWKEVEQWMPQLRIQEMTV